MKIRCTQMEMQFDSILICVHLILATIYLTQEAFLTMIS
jgi:hypothetical protein